MGVGGGGVGLRVAVGAGVAGAAIPVGVGVAVAGAGSAGVGERVVVGVDEWGTWVGACVVGVGAGCVGVGSTQAAHATPRTKSGATAASNHPRRLLIDRTCPSFHETNPDAF